MIVVQVRYRYRVEPTPVQRQLLARTFGCARVVFNDALRCREAAYRAGEKITPAEVQRRVITQAKSRLERAWLSEVPSVALVQSVQDAHRAFANFFDSIKGRRTGRKVGHPRLKARKDNRQSARFTRNGFSLRPNGRLYVAKVGEVRVRWSRDLPSKPSSVTIIREPDGHHYASFVVDVQPRPLLVIEQEAGIDLGIARLATVADTRGNRRDIGNPRHLSRRQRKIARLEREKSRRLKGGANRAKSRRKVAVQHSKTARARRDYHHKQALTVVRENQAVYVEDLNIVGMVRNRRLARALHDVGWGQFLRLLAEKAVRFGRTVHRVNRWLPSTKTCSGCGHVLADLPLSVRTWRCPVCSAVHDRDHNAAINILAAGRAERRNACGAGVRPPLGEALGDEAGSTWAAWPPGNPGGQAEEHVKNSGISPQFVTVDHLRP
ncbi:RNA-guided endonuclease InsQ/TnpB family protein [Crossiella cryophila]|uniref:Putative transposase n=1 Tax=Crossiella cryophila TaxID=43355 RepID=A0A7W7CCX3_9PSEU|nr:RNA-guided endonuclease TnpB family protein [Crossiella cryophila]MBB4678823.1 putative transposase [Crossiella cryophila]